MLIRRHRRTGQTKAADLSPKKEAPEQQEDLNEYTVPELKEKASAKDIDGHANMKKDELIKALQQ